MNVDITTITSERHLQLEREIINVLNTISNSWISKHESLQVMVLIKEVATVCNTADELAIVMFTLGHQWEKIIEKAPVG